MLNTLITAIARLLGVKAPSMEVSVQLTQTAGRALQEPTTPRGNKRSARTTKPQSSPAKPKPKRKPKAVKSTTAGSSPKPKQKPAQPAVKASGEIGSQPATRARRTRQHAK